MSTTFRPPDGFDGVAAEYDEIFTSSLIGRAQRNAVWVIARRHFQAGHRVLELNCGTGEDALFLAAQGMNVLACDVSSAMIDTARRKKLQEAPDAQVEFELLAIESLRTLSPSDRFDAVLSNFSGLNCVADLAPVACDLGRVTNPGAKVVLCLTNKYCLWEIVWHLFHGDLRRAFRRWNPRGVTARIGNASVHVNYPAISKVTEAFSSYFSAVALHGVGIAVPPSYLELWARRVPAGLATCARVDEVLSDWPILRSLGDHFVLVLERTRA